MNKKIICVGNEVRKRLYCIFSIHKYGIGFESDACCTAIWSDEFCCETAGD